MIRTIIHIDEEKCNGCGLCAEACHEAAIRMVGGKARLMRDDYCDGVGDCLPACPVGAITFEKREAAAYNKKAVEENKKAKIISQLKHWPVQIQLAPVRAAGFGRADLLVAADCTAFAYGNIHPDFMKGRTVLVGCPKLDAMDYSEKLTEIIRQNDIKSLTVVRMEVPCCGGIQRAVEKALKNSKKDIPCQVSTISLDGRILE